MSKTLEGPIEELLKAANGANRSNVLGVDSARTFVGDFLRDLDDEFAQFPEERDIAQWNLAAADYSGDEPVAVLFVILEDDELTLLAGQGGPETHFEFGEEEDLPEDAESIEAAAREAFHMGEGVVRISVPDARAWALAK